MKFSNFFFLIFIVGILILSSPSTSAGLDLTPTTNITSDTYEKQGFIIELYSDESTKIDDSEILWQEKGNEFWARYKDEALYDDKAEDPNTLKVPLNEVHFITNKLRGEINCSGGFYRQECSWTQLDFSDFESLNNITNKTITPIYTHEDPTLWENFKLLFLELFGYEPEEDLDIIAYRISYEGLIVNLDPKSCIPGARPYKEEDLVPVISKIVSLGNSLYFSNSSSTKPPNVISLSSESSITTGLSRNL